MPRTYEPIASTTLATNSSTIDFSSIPGTFTDLILVASGTADAFVGLEVQVNGDTSTNYSATLLTGDGTNAGSSRFSSASSMNVGLLSTSQSISIIHFLNYSNTNVNKTILAIGSAPTNQVRRSVGLWRSTAAITSIRIRGGLFSSGYYASIYGIKAA